ncbi:LacI family transcriptional regulator [Subtercola sp. PAMC28395]|uniref:LacI family DNA-binding transcriptional regulator n=1 Tax=Subtercola sp. PAMC28395 TaxID=2846775 RepID=UPI001C0AC37F|nr:LacI family DNA-binding transcriptional regulator [Subtercola sp. PAMC28395]QWT24237.1 LacI family transcriptional regulator [Subtercola sp. PAMC28395]
MKQSGNEAHPTISDVARHAGVSRATTSRALSNYGVVNSETRAKVLRSAEELGYVPNVLARSMRAGSTQTLGLIIAEVGLSVFDLAMRSVIESASLQGYQVLVTNTNEDLVAERASIRVMLEKQVDGLIVVPSAVVDLEFLSKSDLKGKPVTLLDRSLETLGIPSVTADNNRGARDAVEHMHSLGHTKIGLIVVTANLEGETGERPRGLISTIHDRVEGYYAEMTESGLRVDPDWVRYCGDAGDAATTAVCAILDSPEPPTALLASNGNMSLAVLRVAKERGLVIGRDLSLVGFDDAPWATVLTPSLTVVDLPIEEMAKAAVDNLIAQIADPSTEQTSVTLPTRLLVRHSVDDLTAHPGAVIRTPSAPATPLRTQKRALTSP